MRTSIEKGSSDLFFFLVINQRDDDDDDSLEEGEEGGRLDVGHLDVLLALGQAAKEHGVEHGTARRQHVLVRRDRLHRTACRKVFWGLFKFRFCQKKTKKPPAEKKTKKNEPQDPISRTLIS